MALSRSLNTSPALTQRLLHDIAEIRKEPYPNIHLHFKDDNIRDCCLILTPENGPPLHFTIRFPDNYPLQAPKIKIQSAVNHPNVFDNYICASILNTNEGWTSAYTLKGVVIQLLSFFSSDRLEQDTGGYVDLANFRNNNNDPNYYAQYGRVSNNHICGTCGFGTSPLRVIFPSKHLSDSRSGHVMMNDGGRYTKGSAAYKTPSKLLQLPDELWLMVFGELDTTDILTFCDAIPSVQAMVNSYDFIRIRELQCFCLKKSFLETKLGIGIVAERGRLKSEFDLLSHEAFAWHGVRKSIQGVPFDHWLPLPLSRRHWNLVRPDALHGLNALHHVCNLDGVSNVDVLYTFMNSIVVQFSNDSERLRDQSDARSTLTHASEKAVESYFTLFHLLLCLATENDQIVRDANRMVARFLSGPRSKTDFPDLGILLAATLVADGGITENFTYTLIKEAVVRNVVWTLDVVKGRGMPELAYIEPDASSDYRLAQSFAASRTSYRLLMFLKLFSSTARVAGKTLTEIRDSLFDSHGAPPAGTSAWMAQQIREIRNINNFPAFLHMMGIKAKPTKEEFCSFLKRSIKESESAGYSVMPLTQGALFLLRQEKEPAVQMSPEVDINLDVQRWWDKGRRVPSFFPNRGGQGGGRGRGGWRGRGRGWR